MSGPFRAKLEGYFNTTTDIENARAAFKFTWDHFKYLETVGVTTEIARNNGTGATTGSTGWWDDSNAFGSDAWAVFRWNSSSVRTWEWYVLIHAADSYAAGVAAPALVNGSTTVDGLAMAVAISVNTGTGVTSNPWGGITTGALGTHLKSTPVWTTGAVGDSLYVWPRSNSLSGSHSGSRQNEWLATSDVSTNYRASIVSDNDGFVAIFSAPDTVSDFGNNNISLVYPFTPNNVISSSVSGNIKTPLMVINSSDSSFEGLFDPGTDNGGTAGTAARCGGGIIGADGLSVRTLRTDYLRHGLGFSGYVSHDLWGGEIYNFLSGSTRNKWELLDAFLFVSTAEPQYQGYVGQLNSPLVKIIRYAHVGHTSLTGSRIAYSTDRGFDTTSNKALILIPWTGSVTVGKNQGVREGIFISGSIG